MKNLERLTINTVWQLVYFKGTLFEKSDRFKFK